ncbi:MAG: peptidase M3, partial [Acidobacteriota bacterium]
MSQTAATTDNLHLWTNLTTGADAQTWVESHLAASRAQIVTLLAVTEPRTVANTLAPYDQACWHLRMAGSQSGVMFMVHPLAEVRDTAQALQQTISAESVSLSLNRDVYQALATLEGDTIAAEDAATRYYLERTLLGYRLSGVDRDDATRDSIRALADKMTELSMTFSRKVQDDVRKISVDNPSDLRGLPADYLTRHGVTDTNGTLTAAEPVTLTTDPPEMSPVMSYAESPTLRRRMY